MRARAPCAPPGEACADRGAPAAVLRFEALVEQFVRASSETELWFEEGLTAYERLLAHRVAQHHGLQTSTVNKGDMESRVLAVKHEKTGLSQARPAGKGAVRPRRRRRLLARAAPALVAPASSPHAHAGMSLQVRLADIGFQGPGDGQDQQHRHGPAGAGMRVLQKLGEPGRPASANSPGGLQQQMPDGRCAAVQSPSPAALPCRGSPGRGIPPQDSVACGRGPALHSGWDMQHAAAGEQPAASAPAEWAAACRSFSERKQDYQRARSRILPNGMVQPEAPLPASAPVSVPGKGPATSAAGCAPACLALPLRLCCTEGPSGPAWLSPLTAALNAASS